MYNYLLIAASETDAASRFSPLVMRGISATDVCTEWGSTGGHTETCIEATGIPIGAAAGVVMNGLSLG